MSEKFEFGRCMGVYPPGSKPDEEWLKEKLQWISEQARDWKFIKRNFPKRGKGKDVGWVYLAKKGNEYKVGRSNSVAQRINQLGQGVELVAKHRTFNMCYDEKFLLDRLKMDGKHLRGEWFSLNENDVLQLRTYYYDTPDDTFLI